MSLLRLRSRGRQAQQTALDEADKRSAWGAESSLQAGDGKAPDNLGEGDCDEDEDELPSAAEVIASSSKAKGKARAVASLYDDEDDDEHFSEDLDDSADEWQPASKASKGTNSRLSAGKKRARGDDSEDENIEDDAGFFSEDEQDEAIPTKRSKSGKKAELPRAKGKMKAAVPRNRAPLAAAASTSTSTSRTRASGLKAAPASNATSTSSKPNLGRAAGLAALAAGSKMSAKEIIDRLHQARTLAENEFRRARGEQVVDPDFIPRLSGGDHGREAATPSSRASQEVREREDAKGRAGGNDGPDPASSPSAPARTTGPSSTAASSAKPEATANQAARTSQASSSSTLAPAPPMSVASWLGVVPQDGDLPWPTMTPPESIVQDRDSLFIGFVFPFPPPGTSTTATPTPASAFPRLISTYVSHLVRSVQPNVVPVHLLPEHLQSAPAQKRGASHDMYAVRTKVLKFGRDGSRGAVDWAPWEGADDDGERWAAQKIAKVIQDEKADDVLVFVSRWYGGTLLGPDRFVHITNVARATLRHHISLQKVAKLGAQLDELDARAATLRASLAAGTTTSFPSQAPAPASRISQPDMTEAKAQRLLVAKRKMVELLEKKVKEKNEAAADTKADGAATESVA
ncbi:hypothetical protein OC844_004242 [Tilletia horrida]|nr:hypothetical protein OC844_004242 [Tilletia horrida]